MAHGVAVAGDHAYIADWEAGLQIIHVADPTSPLLEGTYNTPDTAYGVAVAGMYAYVADGSSLQVINISNPASPWLVGQCDTPGWAYDVIVSGDYACVADLTAGLAIIDISNPASPSLATSFDTPEMAWRLTLAGNLAYVADGQSGLQIIDVSHPTSPWLAGSYDTPGSAWDATVVNDHVYIADANCGLIILQYQVLEIVTESLPDGMKGCQYDETITATGGMLPYSWSIISGSLPPGLILNHSTGNISGNPESVGNICVTIKVEDDKGATDTREYCLNIEEYFGMKGDPNCDNSIDVLDALMAIHIVLEIIIPSSEQVWAADCNGSVGHCDGDGNVNVLDALKIVNMILELDTCP